MSLDSLNGPVPSVHLDIINLFGPLTITIFKISKVDTGKFLELDLAQ